LTIAWLHAEVLDFDGAIKRCEEVYDFAGEANLHVFFFRRAVLAKTYLGPHDHRAAMAQFDEVTHQIEVEGIGLNYTIYTYFCHSLCEYWLEVKDLAKAREQAVRLYERTASAPDRYHLARAHRLLARIAIAEGKFEEARMQLSHAVSVLENIDLPLAAWRVYLTAAKFYGAVGDNCKASDYQRRCEEVIQTLAANLDQDDPLLSSLLVGFAAESRR
jgi:tetratricopeptide (TPR) repeat protein